MTEILELTAENVYNIFTDCLFRKDEVQDGKPICEPVEGSAVQLKALFHPERLKQNTEKISQMIDQLPNINDGISFLMMCMTDKGQQWGEHANIDQLVALGMATKELSFCLPRDMWAVLPGGMPYIIRQPKSAPTKIAGRQTPGHGCKRQGRENH